MILHLLTKYRWSSSYLGCDARNKQNCRLLLRSMKKLTVCYSIEHSYFQMLQIDTLFLILEMKEENPGKFVFMHFKLRFIGFDSMLDLLFLQVLLILFSGLQIIPEEHRAAVAAQIYLNQNK